MSGRVVRNALDGVIMPRTKLKAHFSKLFLSLGASCRVPQMPGIIHQLTVPRLNLQLLPSKAGTNLTKTVSKWQDSMDFMQIS